MVCTFKGLVTSTAAMIQKNMVVFCLWWMVDGGASWCCAWYGTGGSSARDS
jgi:hypothetical protein